MGMSELLAVARGDAPADLVLRNGQILNVFSGEIEAADVAIVDGLIAGIGPAYAAKEEVDLRRAYLAPGLIDAHVHIESSLCIPAQFAQAVVPCGVTEHGVTSLVDLGIPVTMLEVDAAMRRTFEEIFGPTEPAKVPLLFSHGA